MLSFLGRSALQKGARSLDMPGGRGSEHWLGWDGGAVGWVRGSAVSPAGFGVTVRHLSVLRVVSPGRGLALSLPDGRDWQAPGAETLLLPPGTELRGRAQGELAFAAAMVTPAFARRALPAAALPAAPVLGGLDPRIGLLLEMAGTDARRGDAARIATARAIVRLLCAEVLGAAPDRAPAAEPAQGLLPNWRLQKLDALIADRMAGQIRLTDLAAAVGLSLHHFARSFRRTRGQTPQAYVQSRRVARARDLLGGTDRPLSDIATACGFTSQSHFTTVFRRVEGTTPGRWRLRAAATPAGALRDAAE